MATHFYLRENLLNYWLEYTGYDQDALGAPVIAIF
jgi:hypothetical protein